MLTMGIVDSEKQYIDLVSTQSMTAYVQDGAIVKKSPIAMVLVSSESELDLLDDFAPGTIAYTAGFAKMWQKAPNGNWISFNEEVSDD